MGKMADNAVQTENIISGGRRVKVMVTDAVGTVGWVDLNRC